jgi:5-methylcytosine-specific restriction endonuclease McrA
MNAKEYIKLFRDKNPYLIKELDSLIKKEILPIPVEEPVKKIRKNASKRLNLKRWKDLTSEIMKKPCAFCGHKAQATHHIVAVCVAPELQFEKTNLIPLCKKCHRVQHLDLPELLFK